MLICFIPQASSHWSAYHAPSRDRNTFSGLALALGDCQKKDNAKASLE